MITADGKIVKIYSDPAIVDFWENDHIEIKEQEKLQIGGRTIHAFHFKEKETGREYGSFGVIELGSDVVFTFSYKHVNFGDPAFEDLLGATKFIVE